MNLNKAFLLGRLTNDPDSRVLPSGQPVTNFSVATNRVWTNKEGAKQEDAQFHNIVVFGKLADIASRYLAKGRLVLVEGRIQTRSWEGADGTKKYRTEIIADNIQLGPRPGGETAASDAAPRTMPTGRQAEAKTATKEEEIPIIEQDAETSTDNIPF